MKPRLIIACHKGGVGKSTIALNLAVALAKLGYRTALVDTDPQGGLNISLNKGSMEFQGLAEVLWKKDPVEKVLLKSKLPNLSLLTKGRLAMKNVPQYQKMVFSGEELSAIFDTLEQSHDLLVIDTPAGMGMITRGVMRTGGQVVTPFKVDMMNLRSINQILQVVDLVQREENENTSFLGLVMNMFQKDKESSFKVAGELWQSMPMVLDTTIPQSDFFAKALDLGAPLALIGRQEHPEARRFTALAEEILSLMAPREAADEEVRQLL